MFVILVLKFAGTGSHPELPLTPKSVAFSMILIKKEGDFWSPNKHLKIEYIYITFFKNFKDFNLFLEFFCKKALSFGFKFFLIFIF